MIIRNENGRLLVKRLNSYFPSQKSAKYVDSIKSKQIKGGVMKLYCVIQELERKTPSKGKPKSLVVHTHKINHREFYSYSYSEERFDRPMNKAYKITLHESFRENNKVKKRQYSLCTIGYYDLIEFGYYEFVVDKIKDLSEKLNMTEEEIYGLIYTKLDSLQEKVVSEYEASEESKAYKQQLEIVKKYKKAKREFESKYGSETFDYCYDVYLNLRNKENLDRLKKLYENKKRSYQGENHSNYKYNYNKSSYQEESNSNYKQNYNKRSYQEKNHSNYKNSSNSKSCHSENIGNYNDNDKKILKKIYKTLAKNFHPDKNNNSDESIRAMQIINELKNTWQI